MSKYNTLTLTKASFAERHSRIARILGVGLPTYVAWLNGTKRPKKSQALNWFEWVDLSHIQMDDQLKEWGFSPLVTRQLTRVLFRQRRNRLTNLNEPRVSSATVQSIQASQDLQEKINDLDKKFVSISKRLEENISAPQGSENQKLTKDIDSLKQAIQDIQETSQQLAAPVILPDPKDMQVTLVSSSSLDRLEEYRNEENKWFSVLTLFVGSILGILANLATGGSLNPSAYVVIVIFILMSVFSGWSAVAFRSRANEIRRNILPNNDSKESPDYDKPDREFFSLKGDTAVDEFGLRFGSGSDIPIDAEESEQFISRRR